MSKYSLKELMFEDIAKAYDIFVDMDGVLTNFEGRFEQFAGVTPDEYIAQKSIQVGKDKAYERFIRNNGYSNKHIRIKETERERNKIINNNIKLSY